MDAAEASNSTTDSSNDGPRKVWVMLREVPQGSLGPKVPISSFPSRSRSWNTDTAYPDGLYWGVAYRADTGEDWNLDLWFIREGTTQHDLVHLETIRPRLDRETRVAILRIKESLVGSSAYGREVHGYDVYTAVLDGGVRTPEGLAAWLGERSETG